MKHIDVAATLPASCELDDGHEARFQKLPRREEYFDLGGGSSFSM
ncbi:MAG TPA: hypothetical protein VIM68_04555 [Thermoanaerobaculia bacterium]